MTNKKITDLTEDTTPGIDSVIETTKDPNGTPLSRKAQLQNVLKIINALTADTSPDRTADYGVTYDTSASAAKKVLVKDYGAVSLAAYLGGSVSPADATTYYFGPFPSLGLGTTDANLRVYIPRSGIITRIDLFVNCVAASNETSTVSFRLNSTTDTAITSTLALNSPPVAVSNTSVSIAVSAGDYFNIKWLTPTWVTNPTSLNMTVWIYIT